MGEATLQQRGELFRYVDLEVTDSSLRGTYELDGRRFHETVSFEGVGSLTTPGVASLAELWFLLAGLSYYKAGAPRRIDVGGTPLGVKGSRLLRGAIREGLGEFAYRNDLPSTMSRSRADGSVTDTTSPSTPSAYSSPLAVASIRS